VATRLVRFKVVDPLLVSIAVLAVVVRKTGWVRKSSSGVDRLTFVPMPFRVVIWGDVGLLSVIVSVPVLVPEVVGVNVTLTTQE
jgi:hypothetical protein